MKTPAKRNREAEDAAGPSKPQKKGLGADGIRSVSGLGGESATKQWPSLVSAFIEHNDGLGTVLGLGKRESQMKSSLY